MKTKINFKDFNPIGKYLRPYKKAVWITAGFSGLEKITRIVNPIIYGKIVDIVIQSSTISWHIITFFVSWLALYVFGGWISRKRNIRSNIIGTMVSNDFMTSAISQLIKTPLSFHKNKKIGEVIQRFSRADEYLMRFVTEGIFQVAPQLIAAGISFFVIFWINWKLGLIYLVFIFIYTYVTIIKTDPIIVSRKKINRIFEVAYGDVFDRTPNIISIKSNSSEAYEHERNIKNFSKINTFLEKQIRLWMHLQFWQDNIFTVSYFSLFILGLYFAQQKLITIGEFVMLLAYIGMAYEAINSLGGVYKNLREGLVTINRAYKIFDEIPEDYENPHAIIPVKISGNVEFKNISFSYDKESVLKNINFKVKAGQMVAIVGKSGEGKSTLVDLISRYNIPQKGKILLDGIDINKLQLKFLRDQIAIVPQEIDLFNDSIRNNIAYSKTGATQKEVEKASRLAHCHEFISEFPKKYNQIVGEKGVKLSTGQKQRVAIARAILRDPKILILDEATSALDSESEKYVQEALQEVMKDRTTFVIAHRLSTIRKADIILVIEDGKIVESGDHNELLRHGGVYKKLSELQNISV